MAPGTVQHNLFAWNKMLARYVKTGQYGETMKLFQQMVRDGMYLNTYTFVPVLNACARLRALDVGRNIHMQIIKNECEADVYVGSSLVDMFVKCGSIEDAWKVFKKMPSRNAVAWSAIILGYVKCGQGQKALELSWQMQKEGINPDPGTFVAILNACASVAALEEGKRVHSKLIQSGCESDVFVCNSLVDMYAKCGSIEDAWRVFSEMPKRDVVAWNTMIMGYNKCGQSIKALDLFQEMQLEGPQPTSVTFVGVINACARVGILEKGRKAHTLITRRGWESDVYVANSLVDMYVKCGSIKDAQSVFSKIPKSKCDVVAWSAMILGYVRCGQAQHALELFQQMLQEGVQPSAVTFVGVINACACAAALDQGRSLHTKIIDMGYESHLHVGNSLIDMYAKCGSIDDARGVFNKMPVHDMISWSSMLAGYSKHGHAVAARAHFEQMCQESIGMDGITFVSLLSACSHAGLVEEGLFYLQSMSSVYQVSPIVEHYACMVDLLGRAGRLHEAESLINTMSLKPDKSVWMSMLSACRVHGNVEMGERIANVVFKVDPSHISCYVLLSSIYAAADKQNSKGGPVIEG